MGNNGSKDLLLRFLTLTNENINIKNNEKDIYKNLKPSYIVTILRSFMKDVIKEGEYSMKEVLEKKIKYKEDEINYFITNETNYKKFIMSKFKNALSFIKINKEIELRYPYLDIIAENITEEELDKYIVIKEDKETSQKILIIGILEGEEYDNKKIGYVYGDDELKGRILKIPLTLIKDKGEWQIGDFEVPKTKRVLNGAIIKCSKAETKVPLKITSISFCENGQPIASIINGIPIINITPMGKCSITKNSCVPLTTCWQGGSKNTFLNGNALLLSSDKLKCGIGGIIEILDPKSKLNQI